MIAQELDRLISRFSERDKVILISRLLLKPKRSLDEIGKDLDLTRERVRQLEKAIRNELGSWFQKNQEISSFVDEVHFHTGYIARRSEVAGLIPESTKLVGVPTQSVLEGQFSVLRMVEGLTGSFECDEDWIYAPSAEWVRKRFQEDFENAATEGGFIPSSAIQDAFDGWGSASQEDLIQWAHSLGFKVLQGALLHPRIRSMDDLAAVALEIRGEPMSTLEIHRLVAPTKSPRSLANQLAEHERVQRVGAESWGLVSWGQERFSSIREAIVERVEKLGSVKLQELIEEMTSKFGVAESSVRVYATSWPLKSEKGIVTFQREKVTPAGRPFDRSRGSFVTKNGYAFRTTVTSEHLRGSGSQFPTALAVALGSSIGEQVFFQSTTTTGTLRLGWNGNQSTISTIRAELEAISAAAGDEIMIQFGAGFATVSKLPNPSDDPFEELGRLCLIPAADRVTRIAVARSIGLDETAVWDEILQSVSARKDAHLVKAVQRVMNQLLNPV